MKKKTALTILALNALVLAEAKKLKTNAKSYELAELNFAYLDSQQKDRCIYGQMTGNCFNDRAIELITKSCKRVFTDKSADDDFKDKRMGAVKGELNGKPKESYSARMGYWSPIEVFIDMPRNKNNGNNERLVAFLKGETKTLTLK